MDTPRLQVLIVAYGKKGIDSVASLPHPKLDGVEYLVSWQNADAPPVIPDSLLQRPDFKVFIHPGRGVARNRNNVLEKATAPLILSSDDDVSYTPTQLQSVIDAFEANPDADFLSFRYYSEKNPRKYPLKECSLNERKLPKDYYVGGIEMAWRLEPINRLGIRFDERFGIGGYFCAAEEDLFLDAIRKHKLTARFIPIDICTHPSASTIHKIGETPEYIRTKGACISIISPRIWFLRMITHALRSRKGFKERLDYCRNWLTGVRDLKRLNRSSSFSFS